MGSEYENELVNNSSYLVLIPRSKLRSDSFRKDKTMDSHEDYAKEVIEKIRKKEFLSPATCRAFFMQDKADSLRSLVRANDLDTILSFIYNAVHDDVFRLGMHLLQGILVYSNDSSVKLRIRGILEGLWVSARSSVTRGTSVTFALLNIEDISRDMHKTLFQFYLDTWDYQCDNQVAWSGGADNIIDRVMQRLNDKRYPKTKRWIYILAAGASNNPQKALELLSNLQQDQDELDQLAIAELNRRIVNGKDK